MPSSSCVTPGGRRRRIWAVWPLVIGLSCGCAARAPDPLSSPSVIAARNERVRALQQDLAALLASPALRRATLAVAVESLDRGDPLFSYNAERLLLPASNMKTLTVAAAAELLGWDYRFRTTIWGTGPLEGGELQGDLVVTGSGDPTINDRHESAATVFTRWADQLWNAGLRRVQGRLIGDDRAFDDETLGKGWAWDDLQEGYAAPVGPLQANENTVLLTVAPAFEPGLAASLTLGQGESGLSLDPQVVTGDAGTPTALFVRRLPGTAILRVSGSLAVDATPVVRSVAVINPTTYVASLVRAALESRGIAIDGATVDISDLPELLSPSGEPLLEHRSPPLCVIAAVTMKASRNLYAESLLRSLARTEQPVATVEAGRRVVTRMLEAWGLAPDAVVFADGSGLSRHNYVTADSLLTILRHMANDDRHRDPWLASMPIGGEGTLLSRFKGTSAGGRVRAKTGSLATVRSLAGYIRARGGELLAFAVVMNSATQPRRAVDAPIDALVERLVEFSR
jgi:D-alanyl-D-alanine carboxypeptidase/D-alanyl-D-alanine-endopeptidase (penicillin-binding protein 4)